jgi:hypothetical protein
LPADIDNDAFGSPLVPHMAALAALFAHRDQQAVPARTDLSSLLLNHERRYWNAIAATEGRPLTHAFESVVFVATLFGPLPDRTTAKWALRRTELADGPAEADALVGLHQRVYPCAAAPAGSSALQPLLPDRLAEDFVARYIVRHPDAAAIVLRLMQLNEDESDVDDDAVRRALTVLAATAPTSTYSANES